MTAPASQAGGSHKFAAVHRTFGSVATARRDRSDQDRFLDRDVHSVRPCRFARKNPASLYKTGAPRRSYLIDALRGIGRQGEQHRRELGSDAEICGFCETNYRTDCRALTQTAGPRLLSSIHAS
jgi:hypothetical protein